MLSLDITVHNGIASHGRATAGADHSRPQGLALIPKEPHPWAIGPLGKGAGPRKTRVRTLPDAAFTSTEVVYEVTGTDVTVLPEYGVLP